MQNYEELLRTKYLLGTPKEQYEWVDTLVNRNCKLEASVSHLILTLNSIKEQCSEHTKQFIETVIDINLKP